ncbi:MAG: 30S ribosomal protein S4 [Candidatus Coatesbacteria bacterium]
MSRILGAKCRLCRRESMKLFLKGARCATAKCAIERRQSVPGMHQERRRKQEGYVIQLREKQRMKRLYGVLEGPFVRILDRAGREAGNTSENLLRLLECRLDNVVTRMGFAPSHAAARALVGHGHVQVNGHRVDVASYVVRAGDEVRIASPKVKEQVEGWVKSARDRGAIPGWVEVSDGELKGTVRMLPTRDDISIPVDENLVVTYYSK